jgi:cytidine deaminase
MKLRRSAERPAIPWKDLFALAAKVRVRAYAPYSGFRVGAAVLTANGSIVGGCNVESSSFGLSICAERSAICAGISAAGSVRIVAVAIVTGASRPCPPCGMCRQMMAEFGGTNLLVRSRTLKGSQASYRLGQLLPNAFGAQFL